MLKLLIIGFWAAWYTFVTVSNILHDAAEERSGRLPENWQFVSGNFDAIVKATEIYGLSAQANGVLFAGVILWEFVVAGLLGRALVATTRKPQDYSAVNVAFTISLALWMAFVLADEIFLTFKTGLEGVHLRIFAAQLLSLLAIHLLPSGIFSEISRD